MSRLYHILPKGINTAYTESLTSFICRLAMAHCIPAGALLENLAKPMLGKEHGSATLHKIYNYTAAINGPGTMAQDLISCLENLTHQDALSRITLVPWAEVLTTRNLLRSYRAWCPCCLQELRNQGFEVYEALLWIVEAVKVCSRHHLYLQENCPACSKSSIFLTWQGRPGYCSHCSSWLGLEHSQLTTEQGCRNDEQLSRHLWISNSVGEILAADSSLLKPSREKLAKGLSKAASHFADGNIAGLARQLGVPRNTLWLWCNGKNHPTLSSVLDICYKLGVSPLNLFCDEDLNFPPRTVLKSTTFQGPKTSRQNPRSFPKVTVEKYLRMLLSIENGSFPSLEEVARQLKQDRRTILRHLPELSHEISKRYRAYQRGAKEANIKASCEDIRQIVTKLQKTNQYPSEARVASLMAHPGFLRYEVVRSTLKTAQKSMHFSDSGDL
ncbi:MAG: helix-turn-helix domain-containing protein [Nodosilinea sp. WJT8-NPBG4]|nr:helix-turn-helix domain-containing protein [Nodosilinea sp. WJT8-NPBG4]